MYADVRTAAQQAELLVSELEKLLAQGQVSQVLDLAKRALEVCPENPFLWQQFGKALLRVKQYRNALSAFRQSDELLPNNPDTNRLTSLSLRILGCPVEAELHARKAVQLAPRSPAELLELTAVHFANGQMDEVLKVSKRLLSIQSARAYAYFNIGVAQQAKGRFQAAMSAFERAIRCNPRLAEAYRNLSALKSWQPDDPLLISMIERLRDADTSAKDKVHLCFGLFKAYDQIGNYDLAFEYVQKGNRIERELSEYSLASDVALFRKLRELFGNLVPLNQPRSRTIPIVIVGMPRSGTTLVEQIVSSHRDVTAGGEITYFTYVARELIERNVRPQESDILCFRARYLELIAELSQGRPYVTDKLPHNFRFLGLIAATVPEAKFLHVSRVPNAVLWSNYTHLFSDVGLGYSTCLDDIKSYQELHDDLMETWHHELPQEILEVSYDRLVDDEKGEIPALISDIGLEWDSMCLHPEKNKRSVQTSSFSQIRRKIYSGSSNRWKNYEAFLR